jgi:CubicO group peptidase (beta-lactamase class C family)
MHPNRLLLLLPSLMGIAGAACSDGPAHVPPPGVVDLAAPWARATPEAVGLDGTRLFVAGELAGGIAGMRSLLVVREGKLAFERYYGGATADSLAEIGTATESVVSALIGIALRDRQLDGVDQPAGDFEVVRELRPTEDHLNVTVRHLLTMTGGFAWSGPPDRAYSDWLASGDHLRHLLDRPLTSPPGVSFRHDPAGAHLLGAILEEAAERSLPAYADQLLLGRLGIGRRAWEIIGGRANGGAGLALRPRDLARLGQLHLQEGWSAHRSLLPADWIAQATAPQFAWSVPIGPLDRVTYGFLWWVDLDRGAYFARDRSGQIVYVAPGWEIVVVATTRRPLDGAGRPAVEAAVLGVVVDHVLEAVR